MTPAQVGMLLEQHKALHAGSTSASAGAAMGTGADLLALAG